MRLYSVRYRWCRTRSLRTVKRASLSSGAGGSGDGGASVGSAAPGAASAAVSVPMHLLLLLPPVILAVNGRTEARAEGQAHMRLKAKDS